MGRRPAVSRSTAISAGRAPGYVATVPQIFDLWPDPQERYDIFMNNYTEHTWTLVTFNAKRQKTDADLRASIRRARPRARPTPGPITISGYQRFQWVRDKLQKEGFEHSAADGELNSLAFRLPPKCSTRAARFERPSAFLTVGLRCNADNPKE